mmetsp:Transcript_70975/g.179638  ORF Transcript_70975/g.179638 Transcript_70975/m.179638 type:complete len:98 (+) Transcript_70975:459-752(+)
MLVQTPWRTIHLGRHLWIWSTMLFGQASVCSKGAAMGPALPLGTKVAQETSLRRDMNPVPLRSYAEGKFEAVSPIKLFTVGMNKCERMTHGMHGCLC